MVISNISRYRAVFVVALGLLAVACSKGGTVGIETGPNLGLALYGNLEVIHGEDAIDTPQEVIVRFGQELDKRIFDDDKFERGSRGLTLSYRFLTLTEFRKKILGFIPNTTGASVTVELEFYDPTGALLSRAVVEGRINPNFFIGDLNDAVEEAAKEAAKYTLDTFR